MTDLAPGVKCEIVPAACAGDGIQPLVGMQCTAIQPDRSVPALLALFYGTNGTPDHEHWIVHLQGGDSITCCRKCLRPIEPPHPEDGTWKRVRGITGWAPIKEPA